MKTTRVKRLVTRYAWAGPIIGFAVGFVFGPGVIWEYADFRLKSHSATIEQVKVERELYERLQLLQNQISRLVLQYIALRDRRFHDTNDRQVQNEYNASKANLVSLIREYNRLEVKLSIMEARSPRFFVIPLPPMAPANLRQEASKDGKETVLKWDLPQDPVLIEVENDIKAIFQEHGLKFPSDVLKK